MSRLYFEDSVTGKTIDASRVQIYTAGPLNRHLIGQEVRFRIDYNPWQQGLLKTKAVGKLVMKFDDREDVFHCCYVFRVQKGKGVAYLQRMKENFEFTKAVSNYKRKLERENKA